ncbi:MAG: SUMF1/EgtB/PvdO family nonheme iron enzyme [Parvularculaceae bacterium]
MADVFISYSREDRDMARHVANSLEAEGFSVWWDAVLRAGETYDETTERNLRSAGAVVVLWSKTSANSKWVRAEATVGERSSTLVPALLEECDRPIRFELVQTADLTQWRGDRDDPNWRAFVTDIKAAMGRHEEETPGAADATSSSVETTFWNSIKDGTDKSDFEAYLARYPDGHFVDLANNRIASLSRAAAPARPVAAPAASAPAEIRPQPVAAHRPKPPTKTAHSKPAQSKSSSVDGYIYGGIALGLVVLGVVAFMLLRQPKAATDGEAGSPAQEIAVAAIDAQATDSPAAAVDETAASPEETEILTAADETADAQADAAQDGSVSQGETPAPAPDENTDANETGVAVEDLDSLLASDEGAALLGPAAGEVTTTSPADKTFRDCEYCPLMVRVPAGSFLMGSPDDESGRNAYEGPQHEVTLASFAISAYEVTQEEWAACADDGVCPAKAFSEDTSDLPALGVSWRDANAYARWLSRKTGHTYRLPTEAEWEYAARGGSDTAYWWGDKYDRARLAVGGPRPVGSFAPNAYGVFDMLGNAREWVEDCYVNNYQNAPTDGSALTDGDCGRRVIRGGAWSSPPADIRIANRSRIDQLVRAQYMGVRLAADPQ